MKRFWLVLILILTISSLGFGQKPVDEFDKFEVYGGFSRTGHLTLRENDNLESIENGFNISATYNVSRYVGIKTDFSNTYDNLEGWYISRSTGLAITPSTLWKSRTIMQTAGVGIQFKNNTKVTVVKPFGHILVGYGKRKGNFPTTCPTGTVCPPQYPYYIETSGVSTVFGGGLDIKINRKIDVRAFQFDVNPIFGKQNNYLNFRIGLGVILKF